MEAVRKRVRPGAATLLRGRAPEGRTASRAPCLRRRPPLGERRRPRLGLSAPREVRAARRARLRPAAGAVEARPGGDAAATRGGARRRRGLARSLGHDGIPAADRAAEPGGAADPGADRPLPGRPQACGLRGLERERRRPRLRRRPARSRAQPPAGPGGSGGGRRGRHRPPRHPPRRRGRTPVRGPAHPRGGRPSPPRQPEP